MVFSKKKVENAGFKTLSAFRRSAACRFAPALSIASLDPIQTGRMLRA